MTFSLSEGTPKGQSDAIFADDKSITVTAGAGTGKTWVLTERYVRLLLKDNETLPADILTLTYTEAAAEEMKSRITKRILAAMEDFPDQERKRAIIDGLSDLWISTIHSFAARLIRESGLSLDIDPRASVITTQQEEAFWDDVRNAAEFAKLGELARHYGNRTLRKIADELDSDPDFSAAVALWKAGKLADFAKRTAELHASSGKKWQDMLDWAAQDSTPESAKSEVRKLALEECRQVWDFWIDKELERPRAGGGPGARICDFLDWQKQAHRDNEQELRFFYTQIMTSKDFNGAKNIAKAIDSSLSDWRKTRVPHLKDAAIRLDDELSEPELRLRKTLMKFCGVCWGIWDIMKNKRGLLSFSDMIAHAKAAIDEKGISRKFRYILVDEFQDTDRIQFDMISALANDDNESFFAVGDPKQSIYRFRHADPALFAETITKSARKIELDTSFRTRESLLAVINSLFGKLWLYGLGKSEAMRGLKYDRLAPVAPPNGRNSGTLPNFVALTTPHNKFTLATARKNLAENLARKIHDWVNDGATVWDKKAGAVRTARFSDFAILTPSRSIFPVIEEALSRFGIKSIRDKSGDFFGRGEINDVVCLLRAAADMNDDFAVSGWLMSPFSGVSEDEALACLTRTDKDTRPIELIRENFPKAYARLEKYSLVGEVEGPAGLLEMFDRQRSWLSSYRPNDRMRVLRNVRLAVSIARDFQQSGTSGLKSCAEWLTRAVRDEVEYEEPAWHDEDENAVRLGSVHSAKGLEYPITIVFDQREKKRTETDSLRTSRELGLAFTKFPDEFGLGEDAKPKLAAWEKLLSEHGEDEEQARLFYVACTRAQDSLIFCGLVDEKSGAPHDHTWTKLLLENFDVEPEVAAELPEHIFPKDSAKDEEDSLRPVETVKAVTPLRQISASSFSMFEWCPFAWRRIYRQGRRLQWEDPYEKAEDYDGLAGGAELGSLAHWVLAHWLKEGGKPERLKYWLNSDEVLSQLPGYLRPTWREKAKKAELMNWLSEFASSELGVMLRTQSFEHEKAFRLPLNDRTVMAGSIDAMSGAKVIDYKITSVDRTPPGLYESQLDFYALVRHEMTGAPSVETVIAFLRENRSETRTITDFAGIRGRVERAAELCGTGPFEARLEHCGLCPFRKGCEKNNAEV